MSAGAGFVTVTVKPQVLWLPAASVASIVTVVVPTGKVHGDEICVLVACTR